MDVQNYDTVYTNEDPVLSLQHEENTLNLETISRALASPIQILLATPSLKKCTCFLNKAGLLRLEVPQLKRVMEPRKVLRPVSCNKCNLKRRRKEKYRALLSLC